MKALNEVKYVDTSGFYEECRSIYSWHKIAAKTEKVYDYAIEQPIPNCIQRVKTAMSFGQIVGAIAVFYFMLEILMMVFIELFVPEDDIDICRFFDKQKYSHNPETYGDHEFKIKENQASLLENEEEIPLESAGIKTQINRFIRYNLYKEKGH